MCVIHYLCAHCVLFNCKLARFHYSVFEFALEHGQGWIRREIDSIEASVRSRQVTRTAPHLNAKRFRPIWPAQTAKSLVRDATRPGHKL